MNRVVHFEIHATDLDKMQKFYTDVFGWNITDMGEKFGNYRMVMTGENKPDAVWPGINGGLTPRMGAIPVGGEPVNAYVCTIDIENLDQMMGKVKTAGGTVALDKMEISGVGWIAYMKDVEGNIFGLMQTEKETK